jgi:hypothetical protein
MSFAPDASPVYGQDACKRDGYELDGFKLRVEVAHGAARGGAGGAGGGGGGGGGRGGVSRRTEYRVTVTGLPRTASWQDLKDHMRRAGDVTFTNVSSRAAPMARRRCVGRQHHASTR